LGREKRLPEIPLVFEGTFHDIKKLGDVLLPRIYQYIFKKDLKETHFIPHGIYAANSPPNYNEEVGLHLQYSITCEAATTTIISWNIC
jgi:hypothetical protein